MGQIYFSDTFKVDIETYLYINNQFIIKKNKSPFSRGKFAVQIQSLCRIIKHTEKTVNHNPYACGNYFLQYLKQNNMNKKTHMSECT